MEVASFELPTDREFSLENSTFDFLGEKIKSDSSQSASSLLLRSSIILSKSSLPVSGGVAGDAPAEGVAEDSLLAGARGRLSPSTLLINCPVIAAWRMAFLRLVFFLICAILCL